MGRCIVIAMYTIKIEGMTCDGCMGSVKNSILEIDPAALIQIDLKTGVAKIESKKDEVDLKIWVKWLKT
jgi:copper chaperone CopZ